MLVYIASSWKNQHAVEMLTDLLEDRGHDVACFVRYSGQEREMDDFEAWMKSDAAEACFNYDRSNASAAQLVIYIGPSGPDAWAEVGIAFEAQAIIFGLRAKEEPIGLMRKLITEWFDSYGPLLNAVDLLAP